MAYQDINVAADAEARQELVRLTGAMAIPVIVIGAEVVRGFDKARLKELLGLS